MSDRIPLIPPTISPVSCNKNRPLWSVMIPTYNCIGYLRKTLESVLLQDPGPEQMQIEVIDDYSSDGDVGELVKEIGKGRVAFFQQVENKGSLRNFETCLNRSKGNWIHLLHGDDLVKDGFYSEIETLFNRYPHAGAAITGFTYINENGKESTVQKTILKKSGIIYNWLFKIAQGQLLQPPAVVVKREVYEQLGGFFGVDYGEDWEMWVRIAAKFPVAYSPKCLALYREGNTTNSTSRYILSGQNFKDIRKVIDIVQQYLPIDKRKKLKNLAKKNFSIIYAKACYRLYRDYNNKKAAFILAEGALKMHKNIRTLYWIIRFYNLYLLKKLFYPLHIFRHFTINTAN